MCDSYTSILSQLDGSESVVIAGHNVHADQRLYITCVCYTIRDKIHQPYVIE